MMRASHAAGAACAGACTPTLTTPFDQQALEKWNEMLSPDLRITGAVRGIDRERGGVRDVMTRDVTRQHRRGTWRMQV